MNAELYSDWWYKGKFCRIMEFIGEYVRLSPYFATDDMGNGQGMDIIVRQYDFKYKAKLQ